MKKLNFLDLTQQSANVNLNDLPYGTITQEKDGAIEIDQSVHGESFTWGAQFDFNFQTEKELIEKYEEMELEPYIKDAVHDIIDECIVTDTDEDVVRINLEDVDSPVFTDGIKSKIDEQFNYLMTIMDFNNKGYDIFKDWFFKGKQFHFIKYSQDRKNIAGVYQLNQKNVQKVRKVKTKKETNTMGELVVLMDDPEEYFLYKINDREDSLRFKNFTMHTEDTIHFPTSAICHIHSGIYDRKNNLMLSEIHSAIRTYNQLKQTEDAMAIWRLVRAPLKRVFYVDIGNMNKQQGDEYIRNFAARFKTRQQYNSHTGKLSTGEQGIQSIFEDFYIPRKGDQTAQVDTLETDQASLSLDDLDYWLRKLYKSLNIPRTRLDPEAAYSLGRAAEITRDELKFHKYTKRLRRRFSKLFIDLLRAQLIAQGITDAADFDKIKNQIKFTWAKDNYYEELKRLEILSERLQVLDNINDHVGRWFDPLYVLTVVLDMPEEDANKFLAANPFKREDEEE